MTIGKLLNIFLISLKNIFDEKNSLILVLFLLIKGGGRFEIQFDWLSIDWKEKNFVNPPYNITDKPKFVRKAFEEYQRWKTSILLIPATTEVQWFHEYLIPYAWIYFIKWRVKFRWYNSKWEYVTNKTWQSWSMLCILDPKKDPFMKALYVNHNS